jgi:hypothetical protein
MPAVSIPWEIISFRVTLFFLSPFEFENLYWWSELTGKQPESRNLNYKMGALQEVGEFEDMTLALGVSASRSDLVMQTINNGDISSSLGKLPDGLGKLTELAKSWIKNKKNINRIAVGFNLTHDVSDRITGYGELDNLLPAVEIDLNNSEDFFYQINRPRHSKTINGQKLNRLSKWSVSQSIIYRIPAIGAAQDLQDAEKSKKQKLATSLELDLSTSQDSRELLGDNIVDIFLELISEGLQIASEGDIK